MAAIKIIFFDLKFVLSTTLYLYFYNKLKQVFIVTNTRFVDTISLLKEKAIDHTPGRLATN